ncbi:hypothetical protein GALMADRAFT_135312 [Galerina marginata CBS 339.88]|uniref:Senescence domain-containing protein n=1 Tax=Galerina marginata (strain CBS 339.88) TaxID=685588 RepID=A0A067TFK3_GALM3|nr:hypothetical protein GALMADRAFT_135312 [Galerina marginata CBS 339.88]
MNTAPDAFLLLSLPGASLASTTARTETGVLKLECVSLPNPNSKDSQDHNVYLVLRLNAAETPIDPASVVRRSESAGLRTYSFAGTQTYPTDLTLAIKVPRSNSELENLNTFENILQQYVVDYHDTSSTVPPTIAGQSTTVDIKSGSKDLRGHLVMVNEDTGEVVGEVEDKFRIKEEPAMHERGHENDPVIIEVDEDSARRSDANALEAFAILVPPDQRNWITASANIVSHAISMTTNLLLTTITTASSLYISHSSPSPHHSGAPTPTGSKGPSLAPPPLPPRALVFLTSEKTRKGLSTVHTISGEAVKVSANTIRLLDKMIRRAMGANPKRQQYFAHGTPLAGPSSASLVGPPLPPLTPSPFSRGYASPPPYSPSGGKSSSPGPEKPSLPPRRSMTSVPSHSGAVHVPQANVPPQLPPRLKTKDHLIISADLILSTIDSSTRKMLDVGTEQIGRVVGHKYGPEAAQSSLLMAGTAKNVGLVYVDMRGIGRRALLRRAGMTFVKARMSSSKPVPQQPQVAPPK